MEELCPSPPSTKFDFLALTDEECDELAGNAGVADYTWRQEAGVTEGPGIYALFGEVSTSTGRYAFVQRGERRIGNCEPFVANVDPKAGKMSTCVQFGTDSDVAYYDYPGDLFFTEHGDNSPRTWIGGVARMAVYRRHDGTWLTITYAAAASGDAGPVDRSMCVAIVEERLFLWLMRVRAQDKLDKAAKEAAASGN